MINAKRAVEAVPVQTGDVELKPLYLEALTLVERLHRRLLDVIKDEFDRSGRADEASAALQLAIAVARKTNAKLIEKRALADLETLRNVNRG